MLNEIHHGDCLELMQDIPSGSVDMILCDLPYGTTACKWDTIIPFDKLWAQYERVIKPNGAIVLTAAQPFTSALVMSNPKLFRYEWVWLKSRASGYFNANASPLRAHESVLVFYNQRGTYNPLKVPASPAAIKKNSRNNWNAIKTGGGVYGAGAEQTRHIEDGERHPTTALAIENPNHGNQHPTQKPVALFEYLIRTYTNPGEVVLDNCAGSFTTAVAAENTGRQWICIEQEAKYCEIGRARLAALQPQLALC